MILILIIISISLYLLGIALFIIAISPVLDHFSKWLALIFWPLTTLILGVAIITQAIFYKKSRKHGPDIHH